MAETTFTATYGFARPAFNVTTWHDYMNDNWTKVDSLLSASGYPVFDSIWANDTLYEVGIRVYDDVNFSMWENQVEHTSRELGTFAADRVQHPTYWTIVDIGVVFKSAWVTGTLYRAGDIVTNDGSSYIARGNHTAGTFATDLAADLWEVFAAKGTAGAGTGDVIGPASSVLNRIAVYGDTSGKLLAEGTKTIAELAPLAGPEFTGVPKAPTAALGTNTTQLANTAFVAAAIAALLDSSPGTLDTLNELAAALGDDPNFATSMANALALKAPLADPALTGNPTAPTQAAGNNSTRIATTAFVAAFLTTADLLITGGARVTSADLGTPAGASTVTLDPGDRPLQHLTNNAAFTLAPGANTGSLILDITNGASAGAITTSGFTKVVGAFTTTNGHKFRCSVTVGNAGSLLSIQALQ